MDKIRPFTIIGLLAAILFFTSINPVKSQKLATDSVQVESIVKVHSPHKATVYSALLPGLGQIYNKKYWKLPLVYGAIGGSIYAIIKNTKNYNKYKDGYRDFSSFYNFKHPTGEPQKKPEELKGELRSSFTKLTSYDLTTTNKAVDDYHKTWFKNKKDSYKRNRDLSYIILAGFYVLNIVDAAIDAHFTNFSVDDNLSINVEPAINYSAFTGNTIGLSCRITF